MLPKPVQKVLCVLLIAVFMCTCGCAASTQNTPEPTNTQSATPDVTATPEATPVAAAVFPTPDLSWVNLVGERLLTRDDPSPIELLTRTIQESYLIVRAKYIKDAKDIVPRIEFLELILGDVQAADWIQAEIFDKYCQKKDIVCADGEEYIFCIGILPEIVQQPMNRFYIINSAYAHIKPDGQLAFFNGYSKENDVGLKTIDDLKRYISMIKPLDKSGDSKNLWIEPTGILENAVAFSTHVVRGTVLNINGVYEGYTEITFKIEDVLKGTTNRTEWNINVFTPQVEVGGEYLFLVYELAIAPTPDWRAHSAASQNSVIPTTDTELVNEVYGLLGKPKP